MARAATASIPENMTDSLAEMFAEQEASTQPEVAPTAANLQRDRRFVFRTKPGTIRALSLRIPGISQAYWPDQAKRQLYVQAYERRYSEEQRALHQRLMEKVGDYTIKFTPVIGYNPDGSPIRECFYQTNDPEVATFIRGEMATIGNLYEDVGTLKLRCEYCDDTFENTPDGIAAYNAHLIAVHEG